jgi:hypothetical protein
MTEILLMIAKTSGIFSPAAAFQNKTAAVFDPPAAVFAFFGCKGSTLHRQTGGA